MPLTPAQSPEDGVQVAGSKSSETTKENTEEPSSSLVNNYSPSLSLQ